MASAPRHIWRDPGRPLLNAGEIALNLARRTYIAGLSEWPFDVASVGTFAFYILLPCLTWTTATIAKRLFDTVFMEKVIKVISGALAG